MSNSYPPHPPASMHPAAAAGGGANRGGSHVAPPVPPAGYPQKDAGKGYSDDHQNHSSEDTKAKGDGFWRGCCAGMCCCCLLDACF